MKLGFEGNGSMTRPWIQWLSLLLGFSLVALSQRLGQGQESTGSCSEPRRLTAAVIRHVITSLADRGSASIYWKSDALAGVCGQLKDPPWDRSDPVSKRQGVSAVEKKQADAKPRPGRSALVIKAQSSRSDAARTGSLED